MIKPHDSPLGRTAAYPDRYDPALLFAIPRAPSRAALGIGAQLPFHGVDIWNAYELSWLDARGKPEVALAQFRVPAASPNLIESKSFKLYLNSFNRERMHDVEALRTRLARDVSMAAGADVAVALTRSDGFAQMRLAELDGEVIDGLALDIDDYGPPNPQHLRLAADAREVEESLVCHLLKSNCPVTGQPDWASVQIRYAGPRIDRAGWLRYLVSFRDHAEFHEQCVERIYMDVRRCCTPARLSVYARYTRRGGLDINPWRCDRAHDPPNPRSARQ
ncbi:MAG: NADPH-dependent 7-cyano-7-deazaguanine reductase QueF [Rhodanobacter sp.]|jgi:7-cyano-7-deazaguanine reductase|nr:NADPH-dependent 7-cyano-7-deazaguanine reductase QueF [Rhodanobacter sp.]